jgi:hypothetical protein
MLLKISDTLWLDPSLVQVVQIVQYVPFNTQYFGTLLGEKEEPRRETKPRWDLIVGMAPASPISIKGDATLLSNHFIAHFDTREEAIAVAEKISIAVNPPTNTEHRREERIDQRDEEVSRCDSYALDHRNERVRCSYDMGHLGMHKDLYGKTWK